MTKKNAIELRKKHSQRAKHTGISYVEGDRIDFILNKLAKEFGETKSGILRTALLWYSIFLEEKLK
ncbi:MAG TPA: hypothetical protein VMZ91_10195 [Candidatus Paceibacterota bacterium]|nr:hypothetical protein [Candidatus Paceibacterota bacterium]